MFLSLSTVPVSLRRQPSKSLQSKVAVASCRSFVTAPFVAASVLPPERVAQCALSKDHPQMNTH